MLKQLGAKTIQNRRRGLPITPERTFTHFRSLDLERFLRTKWRKAFPSHVQLSSIPGHHPEPREEWSQPPPAPRGPSPAPEMPPSCREPLHYLYGATAGAVSVVQCPAWTSKEMSAQCLTRLLPGAPRTLNTCTLESCWKHLPRFQVWKYFLKHLTSISLTTGMKCRS